MDYIKLKERKDIVRLGIQDENGKIIKDEQGNEVVIEFDLGSIELPLNYNRCINEINEAKRRLKGKIITIDKRQDTKGKNRLLSKNEEEKVKALKQFYKEMENAMDLFLGQGGTRKFLNGRKPYMEMFDDIDEALKPHMNKLNLTVDGMADRIKNKYKLEEKEEVLTDE